MYLREPPPPPPGGSGGWEAAAWLERLDRDTETAVVMRLSSFAEMLPLQGLAVAPGADAPLAGLASALPSPSSLGEITEDCPWLQERYEDWRRTITPGQSIVVPDRRAWMNLLWSEAEVNYRAIYGGELAPWQRRQSARYLARLMRAGAMVAPSLFDLVAVARGVVDDNLAYEVWRLGTSYRHQDAEHEDELVEVEADQVFPRTRRLRLRQRYEREKRRAAPRAWKRRPGRAPDLWAAQLGGDAICS
jgi:hypothetical protein